MFPNSSSQQLRHLIQRFSQETQNVPDWYIHDKHIFAFTWTGKPLFTRFGNDNKLAEIVGTLSALITNYENMRNPLVSFQAGSYTCVVLSREQLIFFCIYRGPETISQIKLELSLLYYQILSILTNNVISLLINDPRFDPRELLGGTDLLSHSILRNFDETLEQLTQTIHSMYIPIDTRYKISNIMKKYRLKEQSVLFSLLLLNGKIIILLKGKNIPLYIYDLQILLNMIINQPSLRQAEALTPICLPFFNPQDLLYIYSNYVSVQLFPTDISFPTQLQLITHLPQQLQQSSSVQSTSSNQLKSPAAAPPVVSKPNAGLFRFSPFAPTDSDDTMLISNTSTLSTSASADALTTDSNSNNQFSSPLFTPDDPYLHSISPLLPVTSSYIDNITGTIQTNASSLGIFSNNATPHLSSTAPVSHLTSSYRYRPTPTPNTNAVPFSPARVDLAQSLPSALPSPVSFLGTKCIQIASSTNSASPPPPPTSSGGTSDISPLIDRRFSLALLDAIQYFLTIYTPQMQAAHGTIFIPFDLPILHDTRICFVTALSNPMAFPKCQQQTSQLLQQMYKTQSTTVTAAQYIAALIADQIKPIPHASTATGIADISDHPVYSNHLQEQEKEALRLLQNYPPASKKQQHHGQSSLQQSQQSQQSQQQQQTDSLDHVSQTSSSTTTIDNMNNTSSFDNMSLSNKASYTKIQSIPETTESFNDVAMLYSNDLSAAVPSSSSSSSSSSSLRSEPSSSTIQPQIIDLHSNYTHNKPYIADIAPSNPPVVLNPGFLFSLRCRIVQVLCYYLTTVLQLTWHVSLFHELHYYTLTTSPSIPRPSHVDLFDPKSPPPFPLHQSLLPITSPALLNELPRAALAASIRQNDPVLLEKRYQYQQYQQHVHDSTIPSHIISSIPSAQHSSILSSQYFNINFPPTLLSSSSTQNSSTLSAPTRFVSLLSHFIYIDLKSGSMINSQTTAPFNNLTKSGVGLILTAKSDLAQFPTIPDRVVDSSALANAPSREQLGHHWSSQTRAGGLHERKNALAGDSSSSRPNASNTSFPSIGGANTYLTTVATASTSKPPVAVATSASSTHHTRPIIGQHHLPLHVPPRVLDTSQSSSFSLGNQGAVAVTTTHVDGLFPTLNPKVVEESKHQNILAQDMTKVPIAPCGAYVNTNAAHLDLITRYKTLHAKTHTGKDVQMNSHQHICKITGDLGSISPTLHTSEQNSKSLRVVNTWRSKMLSKLPQRELFQPIPGILQGHQRLLRTHVAHIASDPNISPQSLINPMFSAVVDYHTNQDMKYQQEMIKNNKANKRKVVDSKQLSSTRPNAAPGGFPRVQPPNSKSDPTTTNSTTDPHQYQATLHPLNVIADNNNTPMTSTAEPITFVMVEQEDAVIVFQSKVGEYELYCTFPPLTTRESITNSIHNVVNHFATQGANYNFSTIIL